MFNEFSKRSAAVRGTNTPVAEEQLVRIESRTDPQLQSRLELKRQLHEELLEQLNLAVIDKVQPADLRREIAQPGTSTGRAERIREIYVVRRTGLYGDRLSHATETGFEFCVFEEQDAEPVKYFGKSLPENGVFSHVTSDLETQGRIREFQRKLFFTFVEQPFGEVAITYKQIMDDVVVKRHIGRHLLQCALEECYGNIGLALLEGLRAKIDFLLKDGIEIPVNARRVNSLACLHHQ